MLQQRWPRVPRHPFAPDRHVVSAERANGNALRGRKLQPLRKSEKILLQAEKHVLPAVQQVQLVDRHKQVRNTQRSEEHTSELQSQSNLVCRLLLEKKKN